MTFMHTQAGQEAFNLNERLVMIYQGWQYMTAFGRLPIKDSMVLDLKRLQQALELELGEAVTDFIRSSNPNTNCLYVSVDDQTRFLNEVRLVNGVLHTHHRLGITIRDTKDGRNLVVYVQHPQGLTDTPVLDALFEDFIKINSTLEVYRDYEAYKAQQKEKDVSDDFTQSAG